MKYYKIIKDNNFIGVVNSTNFIRYKIRNHSYASADETTGMFVDYLGKFYRSTWMYPIPNEASIQLEQALIIEITQEEYDTLHEAIDNEEEIIDDTEYEIIIPVIHNDDPVEEVTIEFMRSSKINEMSYTCRTTIESGVDVILRGETKHFSLTTQDQINLMNLNTTNQELIPYHADGEEMTFYTAEEINQIISAANELKNYNTAYFNSLKAYINALDTIETIAAITYGTPIPDEYKSDVLRVLE